MSGFYGYPPLCPIVSAVAILLKEVSFRHGSMAAAGISDYHVLSGLRAIIITGQGTCPHRLCKDQVALGQAFLAYGNWDIAEGTFSPSRQLPGGVGNKVQDYGTNGVWSLTAPAVVTAPEIDATPAVGALMLLLGSLAVMRGRRIP